MPSNMELTKQEIERVADLLQETLENCFEEAVESIAGNQGMASRKDKLRIYNELRRYL